jgi:hypothetical protein
LSAGARTVSSISTARRELDVAHGAEQLLQPLRLSGGTLNAGVGAGFDQRTAWHRQIDSTARTSKSFSILFGFFECRACVADSDPTYLVAKEEVVVARPTTPADSHLVLHHEGDFQGLGASRAAALALDPALTVRKLLIGHPLQIHDGARRRLSLICNTLICLGALGASLASAAARV